MLKVLMMGGRRCGKTSALASLFNQMIHGATNDYLTVSDDTILETKLDPVTNQPEPQDSLTNKRLELERFIDKGGNSTFLVDAGPTRNFWDYKLRVQIPGTNKSTTLQFRDVNGEFFDAGGKHHGETQSFIKDCDVFVVVVDTPYLMAGTRAENAAANVVDSIHTFLTQIDNDGGRKEKQVIFVPIKCEKWIQEGNVDEVIQKVEETYEATIKHLEATGKTEVCIIPIQTAGDILFSELRDAYTLYNTLTKENIKCAKVSDRMVILNNGMYHKVKDFEVLNEDIRATFVYLDQAGNEHPSIPKPLPWYHLPIDRKAKYNPHNCEQLPLHIIRFMFNKMEQNAPGGIWGRLASLIFGTITKADLQKALSGLSQRGLIKDNVEGIKTLKRCF